MAVGSLSAWLSRTYFPPTTSGRSIVRYRHHGKTLIEQSGSRPSGGGTGALGNDSNYHHAIDGRLSPLDASRSFNNVVAELQSFCLSDCCRLSLVAVALSGPLLLNWNGGPCRDRSYDHLLKRSSPDYSFYLFRTNTYASQTVPQFVDLSHDKPLNSLISGSSSGTTPERSFLASMIWI